MHPMLKDKITKRECKICGSNDTLELHHIIPKSYGGDDSIENLQWLCKKCHLEKHSQGKVKKASVYLPYDLWIQYKEYEYQQFLQGSPTNLNNFLINLVFNKLNNIGVK